MTGLMQVVFFLILAALSGGFNAGRQSAALTPGSAYVEIVPAPADSGEQQVVPETEPPVQIADEAQEAEAVGMPEVGSYTDPWLSTIPYTIVDHEEISVVLSDILPESSGAPNAWVITGNPKVQDQYEIQLTDIVINGKPYEEEFYPGSLHSVYPGGRNEIYLKPSLIGETRIREASFRLRIYWKAINEPFIDMYVTLSL